LGDNFENFKIFPVLRRTDDAYFVGEPYTLQDRALCWERIPFDRAS